MKIFFEKNKTIIKYIVLIIFYIILLLLFYINRVDFKYIVEVNKKIFTLLSPFVALIIIFYFKIKPSKKITWGDFLTTASLVLTILFFLFQNAIQSNKDTNNELISVYNINNANSINCLMAKKMKNDLDNQDGGFQLYHFITDAYTTNNIALYYKYSGEILGNKLLSVYDIIESTNGLIDIVKKLDTQAALLTSTGEQMKIKKLIIFRNNEIIKRIEDLSNYLECKL